MERILSSVNGRSYRLVFNEAMESTIFEANEVLKQVKFILEEPQKGEGTAGLILKDPAFRETLQQNMINLENISENFNINLEALRSNFLFRKYFKDLEKAKKKAEKAKN